MRYKCIKGMCISKYDEDGFEIPNECGFVTVGSVWERDDSTSIIGGDVHLESVDSDCGFGWIEIPIENLEKNFVQIDGVAAGV